MESSTFWIFGALFFCSFLWLALITLICLARFNSVEDQIQEKAEPKALERARAVAEGAADRVDAATVELRKFKEGIHAEMQRFYGIMRRNEKTLERQAVAEQSSDEEETPDEIPASAFQKPSKEEEMSRAELRALARSRGHRI